MQGKVDGLWGPVETLGADVPASLGFEDSFSPPSNEPEEDIHNSSSAGRLYVPLQDSPQYLAGLEGKLACIQGRAESYRKTESQRLLDALAGSRSSHTAQLMQDHETSHSSLPSEDLITSRGACLSSTIDLQGPLGAVLRRVAPDRVALAPEELCHLLQADLLAQVHESESEPGREVLSFGTTEARNLASGGSYDKRQDAGSGDPSEALDTKETSSDEGEK